MQSTYKFTVIKTMGKRRVLATLTEQQLQAVIILGGGLFGIPSYKHTIAAIRAAATKKERDQLKRRLPATFLSCHYAGSQANKNNAYTYVPVIQLDFDFAENPQLRNQELLGDYLTQLQQLGYNCFRSPSGGLKIAVPVTSDKKAHNQAYTALNQLFKERYGLTGDTNCKGVVRTMLLSHDPLFRWSTTATPVNPFVGYTPSAPVPAVSSINWEQVDASSVAGTFQGVVNQLAATGVSWQPGKHNEFLMGVSECKRRGLRLEEILNLTHTHLAGRYRGDYTREHVTCELSRFYQNYFGKGLSGAAPASGAQPAHVFEHHLSEQLEFIHAELLEKKTLYIDAPTGSGKTHLIKLLAAKLAAKVDLLMPTTALAEQQTSLAVATGEKPLSREQHQAQVLATCYESIGKARQRQATVLVVDEAHELATAYSYRSRTIQEIQRYVSEYEYVIYLSGSMFPLTSGALTGQHVLRFQPASKREVDYDLVELEKVSDSEYFASQVQAGRLNVFYKNNKEELQALYTILITRGLRVALVTADEKQADAYQAIVFRSTLADYDVLLTTCLIQAGVNVNDEQAVHIVFAKGCTLMDYIQFVARFRKVKPSVAICHNGKLGAIPGTNLQADYQHLQAEAALYQAAAQRNAGLDYGEQSFVSMRTPPAGVLKANGFYRPDAYWLLAQAYEAATRGCTGNKNLLDAYLRAHNFNQVRVLTPESDQVRDEQVVSAKKQARKVSKEKMAEIVSKLFDKQLVPKSKAERDVAARFGFLSSYMDREAIQAQPELLTKEATYRRQHNRLAYLVSKHAVRAGLALKEATRVEYEKLAKLEELVGNATSLTPALAHQHATTAFGKLSEKAAHEKMRIVFDFERQRQQQQQQRAFHYLIHGKHQLKAASSTPDPTLDFFFE